MYNFQYVTRKQLSPVKQDLIQVINAVQRQIRKDFTFRYYFVGSAKRNMVTYNLRSNIGYDFDVNIQVNDDECRFSAKEIRTKIRRKEQSQGYYLLDKKADWIKNNGYWSEMRNLYLVKKNCNTNSHKK
ncbi:hypothetical protein D7X98_15450 [bacterium 1XD8-76]|nr:hypothetical protein D7X98_15450 [bacterium 1XD8-76]